MYITGKILVKCVSKNYQRYLFSKYLVCVQERALGETRRKILRCLFPKQTSNVQTGIYIYIYIYINIYIIYIYIYIIYIYIFLKFEFDLNPYILISKIWVYIKTSYFYVYTLDCNVSWIYKQHKDQQVNISYSPSETFILLLFYQPLSFLEKNLPFPTF